VAAVDDVLIDVRGLQKYFPIRGGLLRREVGAVRAVDGIDFHIRRGETLGLVGESGCGKTTVGRAILNLTTPTAGTVLYRFPAISPEEAALYRPVPEGVRPLGLSIFSLVVFIVGLGSLDFGLLLLFAPALVPGSVAALFGVYSGYLTGFGLYLVSGGAASMLFGGALWDLDRWARAPTILLMGVFFFVNLLGFPAGLAGSVLCVVVMGYLTRPTTKAAFPSARKAPPPRLGPAAAPLITEGAIEVGRLTPQAMRHLRRRMQIMFQDPFSSMNPRMLVKDIVGEPLRVHRIPRWFCRRCRTSPLMQSKTIKLSRSFTDPKAPPGPCEICGGTLAWVSGSFTGREVRSRVITLLERVGLNPEHLYRFPHEFSGGQRQRIGIARALALNPEFIVLDEPTSALDVSVQAQILNLLKDLQRELGLTYLFISHHLAVVHHISNRVNVMYVGELVESAATDELFQEPLHPYTKALLSAIPVPDPEVRMQRVILAGDVPSPANPPPGCRFHPRCPVAFEVCGWSPQEVVDALDEEFAERQTKGAREPTHVVQVEMEDDGFRLLVQPGTAPDVLRFVQGIVSADAERVRALKAVATVAAEGDAVVVRLHAGRPPLLREVRRDHSVACHLY